MARPPALASLNNRVSYLVKKIKKKACVILSQVTWTRDGDRAIDHLGPLQPTFMELGTKVPHPIQNTPTINHMNVEARMKIVSRGTM